MAIFLIRLGPGIGHSPFTNTTLTTHDFIHVFITSLCNIACVLYVELCDSRLYNLQAAQLGTSEQHAMQAGVVA